MIINIIRIIIIVFSSNKIKIIYLKKKILIKYYRIIKKTQKKLKKGGNKEESLKNLKKTIDTIYDNDPKKFIKIRELIKKICVDQSLRMTNKKNREVLFELAEKAEIDRKYFEHLNNDDLCNYLKYYDYKETSLLGYQRYTNIVKDNVNYFAFDMLRPGQFIRNVKKSIEALILRNETVYNAVFGDVLDMTTLKKSNFKQLAVWLQQGQQLLIELKNVKFEIHSTLNEGGSTYFKDFWRTDKRIQSTTFFSSLTTYQKENLESLYNTLNYNIEKTEAFLKKLENDDNVQQAMKELQEEQVRMETLRLKLEKDRREKQALTDQQNALRMANVANVVNTVTNVVNSIDKKKHRDISSVTNILNTVTNIARAANEDRRNRH